MEGSKHDVRLFTLEVVNERKREKNRRTKEKTRSGLTELTAHVIS